MAEFDSSDERSESGLENITKRHRGERKLLQAKLQKLKHGIPKGDKKKKKEMTTEMVTLQTELEERHECELKEYEEMGKLAFRVASLSAGGDQESLNSKPCSALEGADVSAVSVKESKAQRRRNKKAAKDRERESQIQYQEAENVHGVRNTEAQALKQILRKRGLGLVEISPDGNCLYAAVAEQLKGRGPQVTMEKLRQQTADHLRSFPENFMPFLTKSDIGDPYTQEEFDVYCEEVEKTAAWGGQLEIRALSSALSVPIETIQSEGPSITIGQEFNCSPVIVVYHRHAYGLGEHYNSVCEKSTDSDEDDFT